MALKVRTAVETEPLSRLLTTLLGQNPDGVDRPGANRQRPLNGLA
jgi:hypothetical protein